MPTLFVGHYGHPLLRGAKHWALLLPAANQPGEYIVYQLTGSTQTYEVADPEIVSLERSQTFMGKVEVGNIEENERQLFENVALAVPVTRGSTEWNCQNWVIEVLNEVKARGMNVEAYSLMALQVLLGGASR